MNSTSFCSISTFKLIDTYWGARHYFRLWRPNKETDTRPCHYEVFTTMCTTDNKQRMNKTITGYHEREEGSKMGGVSGGVSGKVSLKRHLS